MKNLLQNKISVIAIAVFCSILWGSAFPVLKVSYEELQMAPDDTIAKVVFAGMRFLLAGVIVLLFLLFLRPKSIVVTRKQFIVLIILGLVQTALQYYFFYNGLAKVSGMQGAILNSSGTFFTVLLAHFYYQNRDRMNWKKGVGLIAGFTGIIVANWGQEFQMNFQWDGEGFMILSGLTSAIATIMAKELATGIHPFSITGWQLSLGGLMMLFIGLPQLSEGAIVFTPFGWGLFIYSALLSSVAFALWYSILKYNNAGELSMYKFIVPVSGAMLSALFIPGERLNVFIIGAIGLVALGIIIVNYRGKEKEEEVYAPLKERHQSQ